MRILALAVAVMLVGPSVTTIVCAWACLTPPAASEAAAGECHEHSGGASVAIQAAHECLEPGGTAALVPSTAPHAPLAASAADFGHTVALRAAAAVGTIAPPVLRQPPGARVFLIPLRI